MRWALRLLREDASGALSVLCVVRDCEGRWLAGRRAQWVATLGRASGRSERAEPLMQARIRPLRSVASWPRNGPWSLSVLR